MLVNLESLHSIFRPFNLNRFKKIKTKKNDLEKSQNKALMKTMP